MKKIELLSPVGNFDCLKAAVQNGADCVYLGADTFNARASANNFNLDNLEKAINYAHLRDVKVHLALNILIKNNEFEEALKLASKAYEMGIDAIIVQDIGLAQFLLNHFKELPIHASTQMTVNNLNYILELEKIGFKRVVLSRELSLSNIEYICKHSNIEIETFIHGALCISYSGQCLLSSMIGGRSGNRGKCAQACRLPYELINNTSNKCIDKGYLLSPKDLCGLEFIPSLINAGVSCFKIEGRMKSPEYVATVTRIYRKYIDLFYSNNAYKISNDDKKDLLQVFNRGGFSCGYLQDTANTDFVFKDKPNNMGIYLGKISKYNSNKGYITIELSDDVSIGDSLAISNSNSKYYVSELIKNNKNITKAMHQEKVKIGRIKGNIRIGDHVYKIASKELSHNAFLSYSNSENKKIKLNCDISISKDMPILLRVYTDYPPTSMYHNIDITIHSEIYAIKALNTPITADRIISQLSKTGNTPYEFSNININLEDNLYIPSIKALNDLRRNAIEQVENTLLKKYSRTSAKYKLNKFENNICNTESQISVLLNILEPDIDYSELKNIDNIYIPIKYFHLKKYQKCLKQLSELFNLYVYTPTILKDNYKNVFLSIIDNAITNYNLIGFVISNIGYINLLQQYKSKYEFIGNYTLNIFNTYSALFFKELGLQKITPSVELNKYDLNEIINNSNLDTEIIIYGNTPVMTSNYCVIGKTNKCISSCGLKCTSNDKFYLKDRLGFKFRVLPDNIQNITTIYNSKTTSFKPDFNANSYRIDIIDETINEINNITNSIKSNSNITGSNYTNGNFNKDV